MRLRWIVLAIVLVPAASRAQFPLIRNPGTRKADSVAVPPDAAAAKAKLDSVAKTADSTNKEAEDLTSSRVRKTGRTTAIRNALVSNDPQWCNPKPAANGDVVDALKFCKFFDSSRLAADAAKTFWDQRKDDFELGRTMQVVGAAKSESVYLELLSDTWNTIRVSLGGVKTTETGSATTTAAGESEASKDTKTTQFLNKGGPLVLGLQRPLAVLTMMGTRTVVVMADYASFSTSPGGDASTMDSVAFNDAGINVQTRIDGAGRRIDGLFRFHFGREAGGQAFYSAVADGPKAFNAGDFSFGLILEGTTTVTWRKVVVGPHRLLDRSSMIGVSFTR